MPWWNCLQPQENWKSFFFFLWTRDVYVCTAGDTAHIDTIFEFLNTRVNMGVSIFFTAAMIRTFRLARSRGYVGTHLHPTIATWPRFGFFLNVTQIFCYSGPSSYDRPNIRTTWVTTKILVLTYDQSLELRPEFRSKPKRVSACAVVNKDPRCVRKRLSEPRYACLWT
jgi:hypothetical protein